MSIPLTGVSPSQSVRQWEKKEKDKNTKETKIHYLREYDKLKLETQVIKVYRPRDTNFASRVKLFTQGKIIYTCPAGDKYQV